jgi:hypothetical protein
MLDDLRKDSDTSSFFHEEDEVEPLLDAKPKKRGGMGGLKINDSNFLGMTAFQRFIISIMLMMMVCVLGTMFLLVTGKILPF